MVWTKREFKLVSELKILKKEHKIQYYLIWIGLPIKFKNYLNNK